MESFRELHIGYFNIISYNTVTVSLKMSVVISLFAFKIKGSSATPQFLPDNSEASRRNLKWPMK